MGLLPEGTTWLDIATLVVALVGLAFPAVNVVLRVRRDRADTQHAVRMTISIGPRWPDEDICIDLTNPAPRNITMVKAGFAQAPRGQYPAYHWAGMPAARRATHPKVEAAVPQPLPVTLESGMPAHRLTTPVWQVRNDYNNIIPCMRGVRTATGRSTSSRFRRG